MWYRPLRLVHRVGWSCIYCQVSTFECSALCLCPLQFPPCTYFPVCWVLLLILESRWQFSPNLEVLWSPLPWTLWQWTHHFYLAMLNRNPALPAYAHWMPPSQSYTYHWIASPTSSLRREVGWIHVCKQKIMTPMSWLQWHISSPCHRAPKANHSAM